MVAHEARPWRSPLIRVVRRAFDLSGRFPTNDGLTYLIAVWFVLVLVSMVVLPLTGGRLEEALSGFGRNFDEKAAEWVNLVFWSVVYFPLFAWFVRRLHDQGKSGWWMLILPIAIAPSFVEWPELVEGVIKLATFVMLVLLIFWPPTAGANRYGPDPRLPERVNT